MSRPFRIAVRLTSMGHAFSGLTALVRRENNARIHVIATAAVLGLGAAMRLTAEEWALVVLAMAMVWMAEALNTSFEILCDVVHPELHPSLRAAKDIAAGGVLVSAIGAAIVGAIVFFGHV